MHVPPIFCRDFVKCCPIVSSKYHQNLSSLDEGFKSQNALNSVLAAAATQRPPGKLTVLPKPRQSSEEGEIQ